MLPCALPPYQPLLPRGPESSTIMLFKQDPYLRGPLLDADGRVTDGALMTWRACDGSCGGGDSIDLAHHAQRSGEAYQSDTPASHNHHGVPNGQPGDFCASFSSCQRGAANPSARD